MFRSSSLLIAVSLLAAAPLAQHAQVSSVAVDPVDPSRVWVCNRDNASVSVIDVGSGALETVIPVGIWPRSIAFSADGTRAFVANQRGNVGVTKSFVSPFNGRELRGTVSVVDRFTRSVTFTMKNVGTEPYGVAVAPNGQYLAVSSFRSAELRLFNAKNLQPLHTHRFAGSLDFPPPGATAATLDTNRDFLADQADPRAFVIASSSDRIYVTHLIPGFVSALDVSLNAAGLPTGTSTAASIDLNDYGFDVFFNPTPVQTLASQGNSRFLDDIALTPDGTRALVPHLLHNVNHDVNFSFAGLAGDFANRVYPAVSIVDTTNLSFGAAGDSSGRLHHELSDSLAPAEYTPFGPSGETTTAGGIVTLGGSGSPTPGASVTFGVQGTGPGEIAFIAVGDELPTPIPITATGSLLVNPLVIFPVPAGGLTVTVPPVAPGLVFNLQAAVIELATLSIRVSNGLRAVSGAQGFGTDKMGYRAGHPSRVLFNSAGDRAVLLNRGSEDVFLYDTSGGSFELLSVYPPRHQFDERAALDTTTPLGDAPMGMALHEDPSTPNNDAILYVGNEISRSLSRLRVDYDAGLITLDGPQIVTIPPGTDARTLSERIGAELFEDSSRAQTAGNFNNSCASCHYEGGADGNTWQRGAGPRTTMPVYGGPLLTGLILWKGVRFNLGETGPMFGGENGGTGVLTDLEQQGLSDYHKVIPVPLNPNLDPATGLYSANAAMGKDLYFGTNDTGLNPNLRDAGCATCHPDASEQGEVRGYTADFLNPFLTDGDNIQSFSENCIPLQENIVALNVRDVNSAVNVDDDGDGLPDIDRNLDGYSDVETYIPMNIDADDDFTRDDANGYMCPSDPTDPTSPLKVFTRKAQAFSIPTKLAAFSSGPYFHDHAASSLRVLLDPIAQTTHPVFGDPAYPGLRKFFNGEHDLRGHEEFAPSISKVQLTLQSTDVNADISAILDYITSL